MSNATFSVGKPPGGAQLDYLARRKTRYVKRSQEFEAMVDKWISDRLDAIMKIRQLGNQGPQDAFDGFASDMSLRWHLLCVGTSPAAWIERDVTKSAVLMDFRSHRFGRRLRDEDSAERSLVEYQIESLGEDGGPFRQPEPALMEQAVAAGVFAVEWSRYLETLLIRPPGDPPPPTEPFPSFYSKPDREVATAIAELAHCRPAGAYYSILPNDEWLAAGGREECRKPLHCPHCHARHVSRLVQRIEQGPWEPDRRPGKRLAFVRVAVPTGDLGLSSDVQERERENLGFSGWLRSSTRRYTADPGDQTMIRNLDANQDLSWTLTPCEVKAADGLLDGLVARCRAHKMQGGIRFHTIGPRRRLYLHELAVVGELEEGDVAGFARHFGIGGHSPEVAGNPVECVIIAQEYSSAARLAIAGTSWGFDLDRIGAELNEVAHSRSYRPRRSESDQPIGLRGALAWPPLFLLSSVCWWSRWRVLRAMRFKSHRVWGTWAGLLTSDRRHLSAVQRRRREQDPCRMINERSSNPICRLQQRIRRCGTTQTEIARTAGCSPSAVSRFLNEGYGSAQLRQGLEVALQQLHSPDAGHSRRHVGPRLASAKEVSVWLREIGKDQRWLAEESGFSRSKVSRLLSGRTRWNDEAGHRFDAVCDRLATNGIA